MSIPENRPVDCSKSTTPELTIFVKQSMSASTEVGISCKHDELARICISTGRVAEVITARKRESCSRTRGGRPHTHIEHRNSNHANDNYSSCTNGNEGRDAENFLLVGKSLRDRVRSIITPQRDGLPDTEDGEMVLKNPPPGSSPFNRLCETLKDNKCTRSASCFGRLPVSLLNDKSTFWREASFARAADLQWKLEPHQRSCFLKGPKSGGYSFLQIHSGKSPVNAVCFKISSLHKLSFCIVLGSPPEREFWLKSIDLSSKQYPHPIRYLISTIHIAERNQPESGQKKLLAQVHHPEIRKLGNPKIIKSVSSDTPIASGVAFHPIPIARTVILFIPKIQLPIWIVNVRL
nr:hypothetical protein Iba_chr02bCG23790 [Ipomoea batatas]